MNILVRPFGSKLCYSRPDTTWERENKDFYSPECVNEIYWTPIVFARISKAGKCIGEKFADRYYDSINFGMLLHCKPDGEEGLAFSSCVDRTSILPAPLYNPIVLENTDNVFEVTVNGNTVFTAEGGLKVKQVIEDTICKASVLTSLRIGDFVAAELANEKKAASRGGEDVTVRGTFCENETLQFKIIF